MKTRSKWLAGVCALLLAGNVLAASKKAEPKEVSEYIPIAPAVVANYGAASGGMRYLKADVALRVTGGAQAQAAVVHHLPYVRHVLVMLLSDQTEESLATMEGKEQLRKDALAAIQKVMQEEEGKPLVDDLLFNSFVVQR